MAAAEEAEAKLEPFRQWLQVNGARLRGCRIAYGGPSKGFGIVSAGEPPPDGVLMVVPLDLAVTPMRVLQDPLLGPICGDMYKEGHVDDRFLIMLFLTVERLRPNSPWKPYIDMLPTSFNTPLWFSDDELSELKGTSLYRATQLQKQSLKDLFDKKAKSLVSDILHSVDGCEVAFEDFLWANSIFWSRALNIPFPRSYVFPPPYPPAEAAEEQSPQETVWVEGLVPCIDFCNHRLAAGATWEVDGTGSKIGVPSSMYLLSAADESQEDGREIFISYGDKGNEELLYLYGFVLSDNRDDYLMIHYPVDAFKSLPCADFKAELLKAQKSELRCLLPRNLLERSFVSNEHIANVEGNDEAPLTASSFSWSGQRKVPSYLNKLVFPHDFLSSLRTIAMSEQEIGQVTSLLEDVTVSDGKWQPSEMEIQSAVWEVCGDSAALQLLVDLLQSKMMELEEGSGTEECDAELLRNIASTEMGISEQGKIINKNRWSSIVYRRGQKQLARLFLKEAERVLDLCLKEEI